MRTINIFGEINNALTNRVLEEILKFENEDNKIIEENNKKANVKDHQELEPLTVNINSVGGSVTGLFAMYDALNNLQCEVITRCLGEACSAGFILFLVGDKRYMGKNAMLMYHISSYSANGTIDEITNYHLSVEKTQSYIDDIVVTKTNISKTQLDEMKVQDWWIDYDTASYYKIITEDKLEKGEELRCM